MPMPTAGRSASRMEISSSSTSTASSTGSNNNINNNNPFQASSYSLPDKKDNGLAQAREATRRKLSPKSVAARRELKRRQQERGRLLLLAEMVPSEWWKNAEQ